MKQLFLAVLALTASLATSGADETDLAPDFSKMDWQLVEVDGHPAAYRATLNFGETDRISGKAPCNSYFAALTREGDTFRLGAIAATRMACPDLDDETAFFEALSAVTTVEQTPGLLILSGGGHQLSWVQPID